MVTHEWLLQSLKGNMKTRQQLASEFVTLLLENSVGISYSTAFIVGYESAASDYQAKIAELQKQLKEKDEQIENLLADIRWNDLRD